MSYASTQSSLWQDLPSEGRLLIKALATVIGIFVILLLFPVSFVGAGERGVVLTWGAPNGKILEPGIHFIVPISQSVQKMNVRTTNIEFDKERSLGAASNDLQDVTIQVVVNYHLSPEKVGSIFQQYGTSYQETILEPLVREAVKSKSAEYTAEELVTRRAEFSDSVSTLLQTKFAERGFVFERSNIVNLEFSESFNKAIEAKVTAEQDALAAKNKLEQVKFEAEQRVAQAKAEAEAIRIQAEAVTQQGGQSYVDLQAVAKWDGKLPTQMIPGATLPFINLTR
jgi:regulator of protease activity HflC (stomatin/prohibitin superfamily)